MKSLMTIVLALAVGSALVAEQKIQIKDLPAAVQKEVQQEEAKGAIVKNIIAEKDGGKIVYEVETTVGGRTRDLVFDAAGRLMVSEEEVSIDAVPAAVKASLQAAGNVIKIETVTKGGKVTYEAQVEKNGKKSEVAVDAAGKRVKA